MLSSNDEMMTLNATCAFFGGDKPIHYSTLYRGIAAGRYPKPVRIGPNSARWLRSECQKAVQAMIAERDGQWDGIIFTTEPRERLKTRCGKKLKVYGTIGALDGNRMPPPVAMADVREVETATLLTDHVWLQVLPRDWPRWEASVRHGDTISVVGTVCAYPKGGKAEGVDYGLKDAILNETPMVYRGGVKQERAIGGTKMLTVNDIINALEGLTLQDMQLVEFKCREIISRKKAVALDALRADLRERAKQAGFSLREVLQDIEPPKVEKRTLLPVKYRNDQNPDEIWSGRGHRPSWLKAKLAEGRKIEEFATNGAA